MITTLLFFISINILDVELVVIIMALTFLFLLTTGILSFKVFLARYENFNSYLKVMSAFNAPSFAHRSCDSPISHVFLFWFKFLRWNPWSFPLFQHTFLEIQWHELLPLYWSSLWMMIFQILSLHLSGLYHSF